MLRCVLCVLCASLFLGFWACSTASVRVLPGENGINRVVVRDIEKEGAEEAAADAAKEYCEKKNQEAVFLSDKTNYTGKMDEGTRDAVRKASKAASVLGGVGFGASSDTQVPGAVLGSAGVVGTSMTSGKDYQVESTFKCR